MNPATVSYDNQSINISISFEVLLDNPDISKRLVDRMSEKKRAELNQHKRYIDKSRAEISKAYEEMQNLELAYIDKLNEERAKSQHHYRTVKTIKFLLNALDDPKLNDILKFIDGRGY